MGERKEIIDNTIKYTSSNYISRSFVAVKNFVVAKYLGPSVFGVWKTLTLVTSYNEYSNFGFYEGMLREMPIKISQKKEEEADRIRNNVFSAVLIITLLLSSLVFISSFFLKTIFPNFVLTSIRILSLILLFQQGNIFFKYIFRLSKRFDLASITLIMLSITDLILVFFFLLLKTDMLGVLSAMVLSQALTLFYSYIKFKEKKFSFELNKTILVNLLRTGFFIMLTFFIWVLLRSIDLIMVAMFIGGKEVGYYSLAQSFGGILYMIPSIFGLVIGTYVYSRIGQKNEVKEIEKYLTLPLTVLSYVIPIIIGVLYILIPPFISYFLKEFVQSIVVVKILLISTFFVSLMHAPLYNLVALNKQFKVAKLGLFTLCFALLLYYVAIKMGLGISGVAVSTAIVSLFYITTLILFAFHEQKWNFRKIGAFLVKIYLPILYVVLSLILLDYLIKINSDSLFFDIQLTVAKLAVFGIVSIPLIILVNKKTNIVNQLILIIKEKTFKKSN